MYMCFKKVKPNFQIYQLSICKFIIKANFIIAKKCFYF